ncbi:glucose-1-phosphate adenylyltransferase [Treponema endosymbiont of Eucomonympha sp.]|uniref:glucose-1-phosphate adenylyltransferase n=1 Tax=Treponema endosymbiont of Eucomonympha sp. TaxID=1580831 RepID=UPI000AD2BD10|nr:glucose-1-phosphate adenylyltransferase [Treponema endosymbiont of Eucomonympha sp.]
MAKTRPKVLSIVLAGGEGKRLMPLTMDRAKPAVPFGGTYRLIDFVLSNLANSGLTQIAVLTQYKSHSLDRHISITWRMSTMLGSYVTPVPAQQRLGPRWYQGSADAIYQSLNLINDQSPDYVVVFGADNIYRMDVDAMLQYHIDSGLGCTVAGIRVPRKDASAFGIIDADQNHKITEFLEKPADPPGLPDASDESFASMGNYIFSREALVQALHDDAHSADSRHDMGGDVIPRFVNAADAQVYDFRDNEVPGNTEKDADYWRDVGTIDAYHDALPTSQRQRPSPTPAPSGSPAVGTPTVRVALSSPPASTWSLNVTHTVPKPMDSMTPTLPGYRRTASIRCAWESYGRGSSPSPESTTTPTWPASPAQ